MVSMYQIMVTIIGQPADSYQAFLLWMTSNILTVMLVMYFLYIMKLIAGLVKPQGR